MYEAEKKPTSMGQIVNLSPHTTDWPMSNDLQHKRFVVDGYCNRTDCVTYIMKEIRKYVNNKL